MKHQQKGRAFAKMRRAFTITELVIVIAVIAVLAAVLIPTFSNVISNSKKSHDEQYVKEINVALSSYTTENGGVAPANYQELMLALAGYDLCDGSNPFLLATALKQDNMYLIWYENANSVIMINSLESDYAITFTSSKGLGNAVLVFDKTGSGAQLGYVLCSNGTADGKYVAGLYYDYYVTHGGDITKFLNNMSSTYSETNIKNSVKDSAWANAIIGAMKNQNQGYTYSETTANKVLEDAKTTSSISLAITADNVETAQQEVRSALATLAHVSSVAETAEALEGKTVSLAASSDALQNVAVDMSEVQITAIGTTYRKDIGDNKVNTSSFSVDFCGLTLSGLNVAAGDLVSTGAEYQSEKDSSLPGGGYMFTYGLFGTLNAEEGETIKISNLTVKDVKMNLTGATESVDGIEYITASDNAGIIVGYTQGNVILENIVVDGSGDKAGAKGEFVGFDAVAGLVGRAYASKATETLTLKNCEVKNITIKGQRRAAGLVAFASKKVNVVIDGCKLNNVSVVCQRSDEGSPYSGMIGDVGGGAKIEIKGTLEMTGVDQTVSKPGVSDMLADGTDYIKSCWYVTVGGKNIAILKRSEKNATLTFASGAKIIVNGSTFASVDALTVPTATK